MTLLLLALSALKTSADAVSEYREGIRAADRGRWDEVIRRMTAAIAEDRTEAGGRPMFIYGTRYEPYVPYYFLGRAYAEKRDCASALTALNESARQGVAAGTAYGRELARLRAECQRAAPPVETPTPTPQIPPPPIVTPTPVIPRGPDPALVNKALQDARGEVDGATRALQALGRLKSDPNNASLMAGDSALERRETQTRRQLSTASERLEAARVANDISAMEEAGKLAAQARLAFDAIRQDATSLIKRETEQLRLAELNRLRQEIRTQTKDAEGVLDRFKEASEVPPAGARVRDQLRGLSSQARAQLSSNDVDAVQRYLGQLRNVLSAAKVAASGLPTVRPDTGPVPQNLLDAADAYFGGDYEATLGILDAASFQRAPVAAHAYLFRAAARYALYAKNGKKDPAMLQRAVADVRQARASDPALVPSVEAFSPGFRRFFQQSLSG